MQDAAYTNLGYEGLTEELTALITSYPPPFLYINDSTSPRLTSSLISNLLRRISTEITDPGPSKRVVYAHINAVACFTPRLLYDSILNGFTDWTPDWDDGCANWSTDTSHDRWNDTFDAFVHGLRVVHRHLQQSATNAEDIPSAPSPMKKGKQKSAKRGKGKTSDDVNPFVDESSGRGIDFVLFIEQAERLKDNLPELMVPLTRLAEIAMLDISVIMHSHVRWEDIKPPLGAAPEPYFMDIPLLTKELIAQRLACNFTPETESPEAPPGPFHPSFKQLYAHFVTLVAEVSYPYIHDPLEIGYIAAARWPGFVKPILDEFRSRRSNRTLSLDESDDPMDVDAEGDVDEDIAEEASLTLRPPDESTRMRLSRLFTPSLNQALEELYPRQMNATDWASANEPPANFLASQSFSQSQSHLPQYDPGNPFLSPLRRDPSIPSIAKKTPKEEDASELTKCLPRMSKFILVASFLASTNPASSDWRMFGRGLDEKKRKRRVQKTVKTGSGPAKIPQRLLGPTPFALDRMLAILGALIEDNDAEAQARLNMAGSTDVPSDQWTDMETSRVGVYGAVMELASMRLLHRTSHPDRLDGPPMFKCGIPYEVVLVLAKELGVALNDLLWDPI